MIELHHVSKNFGPVTAVRDVSLRIEAGEILGLVGPDGAGKTTLIRLMLGLFHSYTGQIAINGQTDIESCKPYMSYIPQRFSLYQDLTVMENIELIGALYGIRRQALLAQAEHILRFTGLWEFRTRLAGKLSGGMKQKLSLASGLLHSPRIFFLDEPTTGVDPVARRDFWQLLYRLNKDGMTIIVATPYMDEAELCHRVALVNQGRLIRCAAPAALAAEYPHKILELPAVTKGMETILKKCYMLGLQPFGSKYHIITDDAPRTETDVIKCLQTHSLAVSKLQAVAPSLEDVFVLFSAEEKTKEAGRNGSE